MKTKLQKVLELHEKMRGAYFYTPPCSARGRRSYERQNSLNTSVVDDQGNEILIQQETSCSCRNVYYKMKIFINGEKTKKDIRFVKKLLAN